MAMMKKGGRKGGRREGREGERKKEGKKGKNKITSVGEDMERLEPCALQTGM